MKTIFFVYMLTLAVSLAHAQWYTQWENVDTVTTGNVEDTDPVLSHGAFDYASYDANYQWLVFARKTDTAFIIAGKKFFSQNAEWDSSVVSISTTSTDKAQRNPEISQFSYWTSDNSHRGVQLAAWERKDDSVWNIFYSRLRDSNTTWSEPQPLTADTVDNTAIQIRPLKDSTFLAVWKRKTNLLYSFITPQAVTPAETIATSTTDSLEFDLLTHFDQGLLVWTSRDSTGKNIMIAREFSAYSLFSLSVPDTLFFEKSAFNPRLLASPFIEKVVLFEAVLDGNREIFVWENSYRVDPIVENISNDPLADDRNPRAFSFPVITKQAAHTAQPFYFYYEVLTMEKYTKSDTMLIFSGGYHYPDTVRSTGYNRNVCIGASQFFANGHLNVLTVWESNRSGQSHIYARNVIIFSAGVEREPAEVTSFILKQNYPNPFNPSTIISYSLPKAGRVLLKVYDLLGKEVATLVNSYQNSGKYNVTFNASNLSSGVYFCRLQSGQYHVVNKMVLTK